jgi:CHASE2 domain-containing sensor protein
LGERDAGAAGVRIPWRRRPERVDSAPDDCPFPGLVPYTKDDAEFFYGREVEREILIDNLIAYDLCVLYGPSGVGKSSLLRAGVAASPRGPEPASSPRQEDGLIGLVFDTWTGDPAGELERAVEELLDERLGERQLKPQGSLSERIVSAAEALQGWLVIMLDQFEDYAARGPFEDPSAAQPFDLAQLLEEVGSAASFLIAIREDSLALLDRFGDTIPGLFDNLIRLDHLEPTEAATAITGPVERWSAGRLPSDQMSVEEDTLVEAVIEGVSSSDCAQSRPVIRAPYLQLVMRRLWLRERSTGSSTLRLQTLIDLGDCEGIVASHLDDVLADLSSDERALAAQLLRYLVTPSGKRIAMSAADLVAYAKRVNPEVKVKVDAAGEMLERLAGRPRLLQPVGEGRYELTHEALAEPVADWLERQEAKGARRREHRRLLAVFAFVACVLFALTLFHGAVEQLELSTLDMRFSVRGRRAPPRNIVLVRIDDRSTGGEGRLSRVQEGDAIDAIVRDRPRVIAYDVDFFGRKPLAGTVSLLEAINGAERPVILAATALSNGSTNILGGDQVLAEVHAKAAYSAFPRARDGAIRRPIFAFEGLRSFAVATAEAADGRRVTPRGFAGAWIDFYGPPGSIPSVSLWALEHGRVPARELHGKIVVVGVTSPAAADYHQVSGTSEPMTGVELQANAIETVLRHLPLADAPGWLDALVAVGFGLAPLALYVRFRLRDTAVLCAALAVLWLVAAQRAFDSGLVLNVVYPLAALLTGVGALMLAQAISGESIVRRGALGVPQTMHGP